MPAPTEEPEMVTTPSRLSAHGDHRLERAMPARHAANRPVKLNDTQIMVETATNCPPSPAKQSGGNCAQSITVRSIAILISWDHCYAGCPSIGMVTYTMSCGNSKLGVDERSRCNIVMIAAAGIGESHIQLTVYAPWIVLRIGYLRKSGEVHRLNIRLHILLI